MSAPLRNLDPRVLRFLVRLDEELKNAQLEEEKGSLETVEQVREELRAALSAAGNPFTIDNVGCDSLSKINRLLDQVDREFWELHDQSLKGSVSVDDLVTTQNSLKARRQNLQNLEEKLIEYLRLSGLWHFTRSDAFGNQGGSSSCVIS